MGFREGSVPFGFMDEKGQWVGFGVDLGQEIVKALSAHFGKEIELVRQPINPKTRIPLVINGTVDIGIGSTTITLAREKSGRFQPALFSHWYPDYRSQRQCHQGLSGPGRKTRRNGQRIDRQISKASTGPSPPA